MVNARIRREGTRNLLEALENLPQTKASPKRRAYNASRSGGRRVASSRSRARGEWCHPRYGHFYGPGTDSDGALPPAPRVHIDFAVVQTLEALSEPAGIITVVDESRSENGSR